MRQLRWQYRVECGASVLRGPPITANLGQDTLNVRVSNIRLRHLYCVELSRAQNVGLQRCHGPPEGASGASKKRISEQNAVGIVGSDGV